MQLSQLIDKFGLRALTKIQDCEVRGGYASDLLSDVLANAEEGSIWLTHQAHRNVVAVANIKGIAAVVITGGREPHDDLVDVGNQEKVNVLNTEDNSFALAGKLYAAGVK